MSVTSLPAEPTAATEPGASVGRTVRASVVIVSYNGRRHLDRCLRSLLVEGHRDYEVIVVDNASTDGSAEYVERTFPQVKLIRSAANLGFAQANNVAAGLARGFYLAFLNPDTVVEPGWLEALIAALEAHPVAGLSTPRILLLGDPGRINTCGNDMHCTGLTLCRGLGEDRDARLQVAEVSAVSGAAFVIPRHLFAALRGFDDGFFLYMEDADLSWRVRLAGYACLYVPSAVVYHDYSLRFGPDKVFYEERNRYLMLLKGMRWPTLVALVPALLAAEVVTWGFVLLQDRRHLVNKLRAYAWIAKHWGQVMPARRQTQALRKVRDRDLLAACTHRLAFEQTGAGPTAMLAHVAFDPLFFVLHRLALAVIRW